MGELEPWRRADLAAPAPEVAPRLLGALLVAGPVTARIVEVEAYDGPGDPASHAFRGQTPRNAVMFGPPGHLYVYFSYGMHHCMNVVCGPEGTASAVLLRAAAVADGIDVVRERRAGIRDRDLMRGPGRLCQALGVHRDHDGIDVCHPAGPLWLAGGQPVAEDRIAAGPRVGISRAADRPWRFWIDGEPTVSAYKVGGKQRQPARRTGEQRAPAGR